MPMHDHQYPREVKHFIVLFCVVSFKAVEFVTLLKVNDVLG